MQSVAADLLYWKPQVNGLTFATSHDKSLHPKFVYSEGFRFIYDCGLCGTPDRIELCYTHFHSHADSCKQGQLLPTWIHPTFTKEGTVSKARAHWRVHLGLLDLLLHTSWQLGPSVQLRPSLGMRSAWVRQKLYLTYAGGSLFANAEDELHMKNKFWGLGPTMGVEGRWTCYAGLAIDARVRGSLLRGNWYVHQDEDATTPPLQRVQLFDRFKRDLPIAEGALGASYDVALHKVRLSLALLWELLFFWDQNQLLHFLNADSIASFAGNQGDLSVQGYTLRIHLAF